MWQYKFLPEVQKRLQWQIRGNTNTTNSNLEAFRFICAFLILEYHIDTKHLHVALYYNKIPTASWVRMLSAKLSRAAQLMRVLALCMKVAKISSIVSLSIVGDNNRRSDYASRKFFKKRGYLLFSNFSNTFQWIILI